MYYYGNYQQEEVFYEDENGAEQVGYYNNYNLIGMYVTHYTNESNILNISNKMTEPGTYVEEQLMRNIHEVAKMTGKSFQEVYNTVKKMS